MIIIVPQERTAKPTAKPAIQTEQVAVKALNPHVLEVPRAHTALRGLALEIIHPPHKAGLRGEETAQE